VPVNAAGSGALGGGALGGGALGGSGLDGNVEGDSGLVLGVGALDTLEVGELKTPNPPRESNETI
jgi:hypothetical protein